MKKGDFTLPGEAGYEELTLHLARRWGADVIRDSDGTHLSDEITGAGYGIYSTICIIRQHNAFASEHPETQQQTFLCTDPVTAAETDLSVDLLKGFFREQFEINETPGALRYMQVMDRTTGKEVPRESWSYSNGFVAIHNCSRWHQYTVAFLVWRIWEEINMYNYTTNSWTGEHLRQLDPRHPAAWKYLKNWLEDWCRANPDTTVIRFTSLFYNFVWIFGDNDRLKTRFCDWGSYDFTVSPEALDAFEKEYGYALTAEDFVNMGHLQATHRTPSAAKKDYMDMIQRFVAEKAKELTDIAHRFGKKAYVFYDDSWVGMEPYGPYFPQMGFDGLIKCVFSGFECRLCAGATVPVHEIRLHPYLFPVGLGGLPTFSEGGDPAKDAALYWKSTRRALVRQCVDRIGLGGYLHLTEGFPEFVDTIESIADEFRSIKELHAHGAPADLPCRVAVMHTWGSLRSWTLSGHFHETDNNLLIHVNEALSGLPVKVGFISFRDAEEGALDDYDIVINAGKAGDAWSGGEAWRSDLLVEKLTEFVHNGGCYIGIGEPSAVAGYPTFFRMANILGVDQDNGSYACHPARTFDVTSLAGIEPVESVLGEKDNIRLTDNDTLVLAQKHGVPQMTVHPFGKGFGVYMSAFSKGEEGNRMLLDLLIWCAGLKDAPYVTEDFRTEAAWYPEDRILLVMNNTDKPVSSYVRLPERNFAFTLSPMECGQFKID